MFYLIYVTVTNSGRDITIKTFHNPNNQFDIDLEELQSSKEQGNVETNLC